MTASITLTFEPTYQQFEADFDSAAAALSSFSVTFQQVIRGATGAQGIQGPTGATGSPLARIAGQSRRQRIFAADGTAIVDVPLHVLAAPDREDGGTHWVSTGPLGTFIHQISDIYSHGLYTQDDPYNPDFATWLWVRDIEAGATVRGRISWERQETPEDDGRRVTFHSTNGIVIPPEIADEYTMIIPATGHSDSQGSPDDTPLTGTAPFPGDAVMLSRSSVVTPYLGYVQALGIVDLRHAGTGEGETPYAGVAEAMFEGMDAAGSRIPLLLGSTGVGSAALFDLLSRQRMGYWFVFEKFIQNAIYWIKKSGKKPIIGPLLLFHFDPSNASAYGNYTKTATYLELLRRLFEQYNDAVRTLFGLHPLSPPLPVFGPQSTEEDSELWTATTATATLSASTGPVAVNFDVYDSQGRDLRVTVGGVLKTRGTDWMYSGTLSAGTGTNVDKYINGSITFTSPQTGSVVVTGGVKVFSLSLDSCRQAQFLTIFGIGQTGFVCCGPVHQFPVHTDDQHLTSAGNLLSGHQVGRYVDAFMGRKPIYPIHPIKVTRNSSTQFTVAYHVPDGQALAFDTSAVADAIDGNKNFVCWREDTLSQVKITSVAISGTNQVIYQHSSTTAQVWLDHALHADNQTAQTGRNRTTGPRGNLCGNVSHATDLAGSYKDFCVAFRIPIPTGTNTWNVDRSMALYAEYI